MTTNPAGSIKKTVPAPPQPVDVPVPPGSVRSVIEGMTWPGLPSPRLLPQLVVQFQLEQTQWWSPEKLREHQFRQLGHLVRHAAGTVPHYRDLFARIGFDPKQTLTDEVWRRLPLLTRRDLQDHHARLKSTQLPDGHGTVYEGRSSGSTGAPVRVLKTGAEQVFHRAFTLRENLWHRRDLTLRLATIRHPPDPNAAQYPDGVTQANWGGGASVYNTGPAHILRLSTDVPDQVEWLQRVRPDYLLTYPSNLEAIARHCLEKGVTLPGLRDVRTISEVLRPEVRAICRQAFGVEIKDIYSAEEVGNIALQSPASEQLLVQSENLLLELLDDRGRPVAPGETGLVVVTPLHAFAMPLIRYVIGDYAVTGDKAACGRGLPVIEQVLGRIRNMVRLPDGRQHFVNFAGLMAGLEKILQFQIARTAEATLDVRLVVRSALDDAEAETLRGRVRERFGYPFDVTFSYQDAIARAPSGKFIDYVDELEGAPKGNA